MTGQESRRFGNLLAATTMLTYAVIATGAARASTGTTSTCGGWPACATGGVPAGAELVAVGHRLLTAAAGVCLLLTLLLAWRRRADLRVRGAIGVAVLLFGLQVGVGALLATSAAVPGELHLLVAGAVFAALLLALGWELESGAASEPAGSEQLMADAAQPVSDGGAAPAGDTGAAPAGDTGAATSSEGTSRLSLARAYLELTKPRLLWLLCLLSLAGMALATTTGTWPDGVTVVATLAGGVLAVGASGTFNHVAEHEADSQMERTADRPVATDRIPRLNALLFGFSLLALSMAVMVTLVNLVATALTMTAVIYYSVVYTVVLKPNTTWNIAIGGGAGALPAVIGWAAVTGTVGLPALALAGVVVVWTPAHFYNLAIVYREDYERAGYPMYPVVSGVAAARRRILLMLGVTLLATAILVAVTPLGWLLTAASVVVGTVFLASVVSQHRERTDEATLRSFHASNAYLGTVLLAIVAEALLVLA